MTTRDPSGERDRLDTAAADRSARHDAALQADPSPEDLDALADERDMLADARDAAADRRGNGAAAARDRDQARDDRQRSAADRQHSASDRQRAADDAQHLREGMASRNLIGQAQGILMQQLKIAADDAFALLVQASQHRNQKLRDVAALVTSEGWPLQR